MATTSRMFVRLRGAPSARVAAGLAAIAVACGCLALTSAPASAAPTKTIQQVQAQIDALQEDAANASEAWNAARTRQGGIQRKISALRVRIAAATSNYDEISHAVDAIARAAYASGGIEPSLQALLAEDPATFLEQSAALDQVVRSQSTSMRRTQTSRLLLAQLTVQLVQQEKEASSATTDAAAAQRLITDKQAQMTSLLASLRADQRAQLRALQQARRAASLKAARDAAARASRAQARSPYGGGSGNGPDYSTPGDGSASSRARKAVSYALAQVGKRYVAGADGPRTFDCSGLTMAAWAQAGVYLPHYSYSQYSATRHIKRSELRPGDLLFYFRSGAHHVAMYIGGGMMVSASNPNDGVEIIGAWSPWYGSHYTGAGRVA